jgi:hypothetical protein
MDAESTLNFYSFKRRNRDLTEKHKEAPHLRVLQKIG